MTLETYMMSSCIFLHWTQRTPLGPWGNSDLSCPQHRIKDDMLGTRGEGGVLNKLPLSILNRMFDSLIFTYLLELYLVQIIKLSRIRKYVSRTLIHLIEDILILYMCIHCAQTCSVLQFTPAIQARTIPRQQQQQQKKLEGRPQLVKD